MKESIILLCCLIVLTLSGRVGEKAHEKARGSAERLCVGMTGDEVKAIFGDPAVTKREGAREVWYRMYSSSELFVSEEDVGLARLVVSFEEGRVTNWSVY